MYYITVFRILKNGDIEDVRTVGVYKRQIRAYSSVITNTCDIFEDGYYNYACISRIKEGIYKYPEVLEWYEYYRGEDVENVEQVYDIPDPLKNFNLYILG